MLIGPVKLRLACIFPLLAALTMPAGLLAQAAGPELHRFSLPNGLKVILAPDPSAELTCVLVHYALGSRDDPRGYRGLAHLTEHMTFRTASSLQQLEAIGASEFNGITGFDDSYYYAVVPPGALAASLWLEAQRMAFAASDMPEQEFDTERRVVLHEWNDRCNNRVVDLVSALMERLYPKAHAYSRWCDDPGDLRSMKLDHVRWFTQSHYRPERATLVVTGKLDVEQAQALVRQHFAGVRGTGPARPRESLTPRRNHRRISPLRLMEGAKNEHLLLLWPLPGEDDPLRAVYELTTEILSTVLREQLVEATGSIASYANTALIRRDGESLVLLHLVARSNESAGELLSEVDAQIKQLQADGGLSPELVAKERESLANVYLRSMDSLSGRAFTLVGAEETMPDRILAVDAAEIQAALRQHFRPEARARGVLAGAL